MKKIILLITSIFTFVLIFSTASQAGAVFLLIYPGSRAVSLGNSYTAISDDALAPYYNPAGMGLQEKRDIVLMHAPWLTGLGEGMYYEYLSAVIPTNYGVWGGSIIYLTTGEMSAEENNDPTAIWNTFDLAINLSYSYRIRKDLSVGVSGKFIYSFLAPDWIIQRYMGEERGGQGQSVALDLGFFKKFSEKTSLGISLSNLGPGLKYLADGSTDDLPRTFRIGFAQTIIENELNKLLFTTDLTKVIAGIKLDSLSKEDFTFELTKIIAKYNRDVDPVTGDTLPQLSLLEAEFLDTWLGAGFEYTYYNLLSLRLGYFLDYYGQRYGFTFGGGIIVKNSFRLDLGIDSDIYSFPTTNYRISIGFRW
ncbi:MAG: PorV/PorQ family protein [bacterium]|nr:PorV/PorQ family protein [bacterium]